ncbi:MAG TPA: CARDB domain-containing protein [Vicinamibacteria bacterium]
MRQATMIAALFTLGLASTSAPVSSQQIERKDVPDGPAPTVEAVEIEGAKGLFHASPDRPAAIPNHPPIDQIPPMPMPELAPDRPPAPGPGAGVLYDPRTGKTREMPAELRDVAKEFAMGGGYTGADGGAGDLDINRPATMSGGMTLQSAATRATFPWRMNVKVVMRFGTSYFVCSGTMRDAETVLTAGHCVNNGSGGAWADEIWVYPGWDGIGSINPAPPSIANPYGWARGTFFGSWTGWTVNGDFNYDAGLIGVTRAVGMLTGWFGWSYGGSCAFWTSTTVNNASYPAEGCGTPGLHNGRDMYYWFGNFDSCPDFNRLRLNTSGGCFNAVWGGMSGSGVYYIDGNGDRFVHGITSTSNRSTVADYTRQWQDWVNFTDGSFIPDVRGAAFDLQPLDVNAGPSTIVAGQSTSLLNHLAVNATNASANGNWTFRVYLSTNDNIDSGDTLLSTQNYNWNFVPLSSVTVNMASVTIPGNTPPGNYYLGLIYDSATDGDTSNNDTDGWDAVPITVTAPNLDVTLVSAPPSAEPGDLVSVSNTVANTGNATAGSFRVGLYLSTDTTCTTADTFLASRTIASLGVGGSSNANTSVTIPSGTALGTRYVCVIADDLLQVPESNEGNNTGFTSINIVRADLAVTVVTAPANASPGSSINVSNTVANSGTGAAGSFRVGLYLSADTTCTTADTFLASRNVASLAAGVSTNASTPVTIPAGTPLGNRYVCVIADDLSQVTESDESNNTASRLVAILSATPVITLKVNGLHPVPPVVNVTGPMLLTLDVSASTYTASVSWYWAFVLNGQLRWVTSSGVSTTPAPLLTAPPTALTNVTLLNLTLPPATTMTNYFFMQNGATVVAIDSITAVRP